MEEESCQAKHLHCALSHKGLRTAPANTNTDVRNEVDGGQLVGTEPALELTAPEGKSQGLVGLKAAVGNVMPLQMKLLCGRYHTLPPSLF